MTKGKTAVTAKYGGFWVRFLALIIDSIIIGIATAPIKYILFPSTANFDLSAIGTAAEAATTGPAFTQADQFQALVNLLYFVLLTFFFGATLGKMALGLKVTDLNGKKPDIFNVIIRETIGKFVSAILIGIGFIWVGLDSRKQGLHDKIAKTLVVKK